jgi:3-isopropylmalate/(R)-2-methylmalate dehydratase large subunit
MGKTIYQKILEKASGLSPLKPGDTIWLKPEWVGIMDTRWRQREGFLADVGLDRVPYPDKVVAVVDHNSHPLPESAAAGFAEQVRFNQPKGAAEQVTSFEAFANRNGIKLYSPAQGGLMIQVLAEEGYIRPGVFAVSDDPEIEAGGGLGALVKGVGDGMWMPMLIDKLWFDVPEVVKINLTGRLQKGVTTVDLRYLLHAQLGEEFGKYLEFTGPAVSEMSIDERLNLCAILYLSGTYGIVGPDQKTIDYVRSVTDKPFEPLVSDPDAEYAATYDYDLSTLEPRIAFPPTLHDSRPVSEARGLKIDQAVIGSCANGRITDLRMAAEILKGNRVDPSVRLLITPVSQKVQKQAEQEGLLNIFRLSGAHITVPSCGACAGRIGKLEAGEVCISTTTNNNAGRMGSKDADVYLASAATVAASAIRGTMTDPREFYH